MNNQDENFVDSEIDNILEISAENKLVTTLEKFTRLQFDDDITEKHETSKFKLSEHLVTLLRDCLDRALVLERRDCERTDLKPESLECDRKLNHTSEKNELLELRAAIGTSLSLIQDIISAKGK